jgi:hypothetical protein
LNGVDPILSSSSSESGISTNILFFRAVDVSPAGVEPTPSSILPSGNSLKGSLCGCCGVVSSFFGDGPPAEDENPSVL